jgi:hypothetical protein
VGIDAHKKDLFIAMLIGQQKTPVTWQVANERGLTKRPSISDQRLLPEGLQTQITPHQRLGVTASPDAAVLYGLGPAKHEHPAQGESTDPLIRAAPPASAIADPQRECWFFSTVRNSGSRLLHSACLGCRTKSRPPDLCASVAEPK